MLALIMRSSVSLVALLAVFGKADAANVTCINDGATKCPYTEATTSQLQSLISTFCGDDGGYPYYEYYEAINGELPEMYYEVGSDCVSYGESDTCFDQDTCNSALNEIISYCDGTGEFWAVGTLMVGEVGFSVIPCPLG